MKYGMNLLLWTSGVTDQHYPLLADIRGWGFDGVELPLFEFDVSHAKKVGAELRKNDLACTAVTPKTNRRRISRMPSDNSIQGHGGQLRRPVVLATYQTATNKAL